MKEEEKFTQEIRKNFKIIKIKFAIIIGILVALFLLIVTSSKAQDTLFSTLSLPIFNGVLLQEDTTTNAIPLKKGWELRFDLIPFGSIVQASSDNDTQLEAKTFIGSGVGISFVKRNTIGLNLAMLFYSGEEKKIYPLVALGGVIFFKSRIAISPCYDFGKVEGSLPAWKERIKILVSYNFDLLK